MQILSLFLPKKVFTIQVLLYIIISGSTKEEMGNMARGRKRIDLTGQRFGRLVVISLNEEITRQKKNTCWNCKCDCGKEKVVQGGHLKCGGTTSCGCHQKEIVKKILKGKNGRILKGKNGRILKGKVGENGLHWKGGITPISKHLGNSPVVKQWFSNSKQQANYTCELTGKVGMELRTHHLKAFSTIVKEAHELHNIQVKPQVKDYTEEELHKLEEYVESWHKDNSNAVVLCKEAHDLFHKAKNKGGYGHSNNTPEQYEEFKQRYLNGEFEGLI